MSEEREERIVDINYYNNGNKRYEVPRLNGQLHGLARWWWGNGQLREESNWLNGQRHGLRRCWWWYDGSFYSFELWHKDTLMVDFEFAFVPKAKASAPKPNKPMFSTNQFKSFFE